MKRLLFLGTTMAVLAGSQLKAQFVQASKEEIIALTPDWKGERFPDGRPKDEVSVNEPETHEVLAT